jgi:hypothetical protein
MPLGSRATVLVLGVLGVLYCLAWLWTSEAGQRDCFNFYTGIGKLGSGHGEMSKAMLLSTDSGDGLGSQYLPSCYWLVSGDTESGGP